MRDTPEYDVLTQESAYVQHNQQHQQAGSAASSSSGSSATHNLPNTADNTSAGRANMQFFLPALFCMAADTGVHTLTGATARAGACAAHSDHTCEHTSINSNFLHQSPLSLCTFNSDNRCDCRCYPFSLLLLLLLVLLPLLVACVCCLRID